MAMLQTFALSFYPGSKLRETKGMVGKVVAIASEMDPAQYARIENSKTDPVLSSLVKVIKLSECGWPNSSAPMTFR
jgi:hypothetical protein